MIGLKNGTSWKEPPELLHGSLFMLKLCRNIEHFRLKFFHITNISWVMAGREDRLIIRRRARALANPTFDLSGVAVHRFGIAVLVILPETKTNIRIVVKDLRLHFW
jgi:hypothetical protein